MGPISPWGAASLRCAWSITTAPAHAQIQVSFTPIGDPNQPVSFPDWKGEYFNNVSLDGTPALLRNDGSINFDWTNTSPDPRIQTTNFSVRWSRRRNFTGGLYRLRHHRGRRHAGVDRWQSGVR